MKFARLALATLFIASCAYADSIGSFATGASNLGNVNTAMNYAGFSLLPTLGSGTAPTYTLNPTTVWEAPPANSTWIGHLPTDGPGGLTPPNGFYTFNTQFTTTGAYSGSITVDADDTTQVFLDGALIMNFGALGTDIHCGDAIPNCTLTDTTSISGMTGIHTLNFLVLSSGPIPCNGCNPMGMAFGGTVNVAGGVIPEPNTLVLLGSGFGLAGLALRRRSKLV